MTSECPVAPIDPNLDESLGIQKRKEGKKERKRIPFCFGVIFGGGQRALEENGYESKNQPSSPKEGKNAQKGQEWEGEEKGEKGKKEREQRGTSSSFLTSWTSWKGLGLFGPRGR